MKVVKFKDIIRTAIMMTMGMWTSMLIGVNIDVPIIGTIFIWLMTAFMFCERITINNKE